MPLRDRRFMHHMASGRYERLLSDREEVARWEQFALRTANTPGRNRAVLQLPFRQTDGAQWAAWLVYRFDSEIKTIDRIQASFETVFLSDPSQGPIHLPSELEGEPIFEGRSR